MKKYFKLTLILGIVLISSGLRSQILYIPSGASGIGTSTIAGKVGIGISNPSEVLHINGSIRGNQSGALRISTGNGYLDIGPKSTSYMNFITDRPLYLFDKPIRITGMISSSSGNLQLGVAGNPKVFITTDGKVGIGQPNPSRQLDINGSQLWHFDTDINLAVINWQLTDKPGPTLSAYNDLNSAHIPLSFAASYFYFASGSVGIGTFNSQGYKLAVDGGIICEELKVIKDVPNSDHVFHFDYKLMSLQELEKFVKINSHLPEIPSASDFKENGYKVGEMDDLLLRKVEELTLYIIELNKKIESIEKENNELKSQISSMND